MSRRVLVTGRLPEAGLAPLREAGLLLDIYEGGDPIPRGELLRRARGASGLVTLLSEKVDAELLDAAGDSLKVVANYAVGYDNVDVAACRKRGVIVVNTPDVLTDATADLAFALLLAAARRVTEGDDLVRSGGWTGWRPDQLLGVQVTGKVLGVVGMGRIGAAVARRAAGFDMHVLYFNRTPSPVAATLGAEYVPLDDLLQRSDFVSVHAPLNDASHHLIGARELALMKRTAVLVNTARGPVVDEKALVAALREGAIHGAGLDVYENEPALEPGLAELPNVVLTPHVGSATGETRTAMARLCAQAVADVLSGRTPPNVVTN